MRGKDTKERIVEEAFALFASRGFHAVSVRDIAAAVGIKDASLYNHFSGKQAIFDAIVRDALERTRRFFGERNILFDVSDDANPKILSPVNQCEYFLDQSRPSVQQLVLKADGSYDARKLFWFINGQYVNEGQAGEGFFWPMHEGRHRITVTDDYGRSSSIMITIR